MATPARTVGRVLTGFGALVLLCVVLVGAPVALLALAGNPLPEQVPTLAEIGTVLTSRDDGQLFLRALALAGWAGWATFALSVLVELGALAFRRPAPRLPGISRQQRAAAALVGSVALILAASPAAASAAAVAAGPPALAAAPSATLTLPHQTDGPHRLALAAPNGLDRPAPDLSHGLAGPTLDLSHGHAGRALDLSPERAGPALDLSPERAGPVLAAQAGLTGPPSGAPRTSSAPGAAQSAEATAPADPARRAPVYRVAKGDHLGSIAERYLDSFGEYPTLARLNRLADPDRIHPGQLLRLPADAQDRGARPHATGRLVARPTPQRPAAPAAPPVERQTPAPSGESAPEPSKDGPVMTVGAARPGDPDRVNRPLAVSAILAVSSIIGAQIGAVLGLRRRPATASAVRGATATAGGRTDRAGTGWGGATGRAGRPGGKTWTPPDIPVGRHRRH